MHTKILIFILFTMSTTLLSNNKYYLLLQKKYGGFLGNGGKSTPAIWTSKTFKALTPIIKFDFWKSYSLEKVYSTPLQKLVFMKTTEYQNRISALISFYKKVKNTRWRFKIELKEAQYNLKRNKMVITFPTSYENIKYHGKKYYSITTHKNNREKLYIFTKTKGNGNRIEFTCSIKKALEIEKTKSAIISFQIVKLNIANNPKIDFYTNKYHQLSLSNTNSIYTITPANCLQENPNIIWIISEKRETPYNKKSPAYIYNKSDTYYTQQLKNNKETGIYKVYSYENKNRLLESGFRINGKRFGFVKRYHRKKRMDLITKYSFKNDYLHGNAICTSKNKRLKVTMNFIKGKPKGWLTAYFDNKIFFKLLIYYKGSLVRNRFIEYKNNRPFKRSTLGWSNMEKTITTFFPRENYFGNDPKLFWL